MICAITCCSIKAFLIQCLGRYNYEVPEVSRYEPRNKWKPPKKHLLLNKKIYNRNVYQKKNSFPSSLFELAPSIKLYVHSHIMHALINMASIVVQ